MPSGDEPSLSRESTDSQVPALGGDAGTIHLLQALEDEDADVRNRAMFALAERGDARVIDALIRALMEDSRSLLRRTRESVVEAHLARFGQPAIAPLVAQLDPPNRSGEHAVLVLGMIAEQHETLRDEIRPHLVRALREHRYSKAPAALTQCGDSLQILADALADSTIPGLHRPIIDALKHYGADAFPVIRSYIRNAPTGQRALLGKYVYFQVDAVPDELIYFMRNHADDTVRAEALRVLLANHDKHQVPDFASVTEIALQALNDPSDTLRVYALRWLGERRDRAYLPLLLEAARSEDEQTRAAAAYGLGLGGFPEGAPVIVELLSDGSQLVEAEAMRATRQMRLMAALPRLREILRSSGHSPRTYMAIKTLALIGDPEIVPDLNAHIAEGIEAASNRGIDELLEALAALRDASANESLLMWFNTPEVRPYAALPLARTGTEEAAHALVGWAHALIEDDGIHMALIRALATLGGQHAVDALVHLGQTEAGAEPYSRRAIIRALQDIGTPEALAACDLLA